MAAAPHVLISGGSIAGAGLAVWLNRYGFRTTVVERAPRFRDGGQNVDVRGAGREVLRRAGLEDAVLAATTGEEGTRFVDGDGVTVAEFSAGRSDSDGATAEVEVLRGDLARILVDASQPATAYVYGDRIVGLDEDDAGVSVSFEHAEPQRFDLVVAADGLRSSTRALAFGDEAEIRDLGLEVSYLTIPRTEDDVAWWRWYSAPGGRSVNLRPDRHGTTRALLSANADATAEQDRREGRTPGASGPHDRSPAEQRARLKEQFADAGWETDRVLAALDDADDLYAEAIAQVRSPRWSTGRVALTGDAAWCASPVSGMGTTLAIVGSYVLAGELAAHSDRREALRSYEEVMRPYVEQAQDLPPGTPRLANPSSRVGIAAFRTVLRLAASRTFQAVGGRLFSPPAEAIELPDYAHLLPT